MDETVTAHTITNAELVALRAKAQVETEPGWCDEELIELCEAALAGDHRARAECARIHAKAAAR